LFKVLSTGTNTCPQPWPPLINGLVDDTLLELSSAFKFCKVVWRHSHDYSLFPFPFFRTPLFPIPMPIPIIMYFRNNKSREMYTILLR